MQVWSGSGASMPWRRYVVPFSTSVSPSVREKAASALATEAHNKVPPRAAKTAAATADGLQVHRCALGSPASPSIVIGIIESLFPTSQLTFPDASRDDFHSLGM